MQQPDSDRLIGELMRIHAGRHEMYREDEAHAWLLANGYIDAMDTLTATGDGACDRIIAAFERGIVPRQGELF
jgi:hypothetical protein